MGGISIPISVYGQKVLRSFRVCTCQLYGWDWARLMTLCLALGVDLRREFRAGANGGEQVSGLSVVAEGLADVGVPVDVAGAEDETAAELEGVLAEPDLPVSGRLGALASLGVIGAQQVQQVGLFQANGAIGRALVVDQERECDAGLFAEQAGVVGVAQAYRSEVCSFVFEGLLVLAQLRDVLSAENSTVVPQENQDRGLRLPKGAKLDLAAIGIGENDAGQGFAKRAGHRSRIRSSIQAPHRPSPERLCQRKPHIHV